MHSMQEVHKSVYEDHSKDYVELVAISWHELLIHWKYCFDKAKLKKVWSISLVLFTLAMDVFYSYPIACGQKRVKSCIPY